ncbi:Translation machinery-associated protein 46 [Coemansia sp. RSA 1813]|nr:Translation machinery-associated protein 46 [Coemansia sp. RSA 1646]KAJ1766728.1 Translation machinery-associated protein 46 [Coemansia sp. RSA 1843]KAJ2086465.1 Translation machinery-associated protein 46 [Coemansia sp. RSA 986]KAJ2215025.1 Translation machinery-associated protein 46 [Coemansia sp. RSA 487]KAJ2564773.1 Translation machinery-associated protein 46 [Coemansia sp. RSA 1813]
MPPKQQQGKKTVEKKKKQTVEDKTFGLKNKHRSTKVANYVKQVEQQVKSSGDPRKRKAEEEKRMMQLSKKEEEQKKKDELAMFFKPVVQQKVPFGVNPKTVVCEMFKLGACEKTAQRCKFSHDLSVGRKGTKLDVYTDRRDEGDKNTDTIDTWDQSKLEEVVLSKHGNPQTSTTIVCKYFLQAIENGKYGWFWDCPNGGDKCKYKHALPPGFVLKKDKKPLDSKSEISLEEFLETERHKLGSNLTPVTLESFTSWKKERQLRKEEEETTARQAKEKAFKAGKLAKMSGRDFFEFNPDLQTGGDDDVDEYDFSEFRNSDGGYQRDGDDDAVDQKKDNQGKAAGSGTAPHNEALFAAENLEDLDINDSDDE